MKVQLTTKSVKAITEEKESKEQIPKVRWRLSELPESHGRRYKQNEAGFGNGKNWADVETKIEKQQRGGLLSGEGTKPEVRDTLKEKSNWTILKMETWKPLEVTKIGAKIMSVITVGGHEEMRNLS